MFSPSRGQFGEGNIMFRYLLVGACLFALSGCATVVYSQQKLVGKFTYDGVTYDVYDATQEDLDGPGGTTITQKGWKRLFPEGYNPYAESTSPTPFGTNAVIAQCRGSLAECKPKFGAALEARKDRTAKAAQGGDGGMY